MRLFSLTASRDGSASPCPDKRTYQGPNGKCHYTDLLRARSWEGQFPQAARRATLSAGGRSSHQHARGTYMDDPKRERLSA